MASGASQQGTNGAARGGAAAAAAAAVRVGSGGVGVGGLGVGGGGGKPRAVKRPLAHIDDLTACPSDINPQKSLNQLLDDALGRFKRAESSLSFGARLDLAFKDFVGASIIALDVVRNHKEYSSLKDHASLRMKHEGLLAQINAAQSAFDDIKQAIIVDNQRTGIRPTVPRQSHSRVSSMSQPTTPIPSAQNDSLQQQQQQQPASYAPVIESIASNASRRSEPIASPTLPIHPDAIPDPLFARFSQLGGPQPQIKSQRVQDPRIRTHPIVPPKPSGPRPLPSAPANKPQVSLVTALTSLPKVPDAIYSPARGTVSSEAAQLPSSTPRGLFSRTRSSASMTCTSYPNNPYSNNNAGHHSSNRGPPAATIKLSDSGHQISPQDLYRLLSKGANILIIDVRPRDQFDQGHISSSSTICVEPTVLERRQDYISAETIADSNVVAPQIEQDLFKKRSEFDLIVFYDDCSHLAPNPSSDQEEILWTLYEALARYDEPPPDLSPRLLAGGLAAWTNFMGTSSLARSQTTPFSAKATRHRSTMNRASIASTYVPKPLKPEEARKWQNAVDNDKPRDDDAMSIDIARTTSEFFRKYPDVTNKQSMISSNYGSSHKGDLATELPSPPTRPAPALPRPSHIGLSNSPSEPVVPMAAIARAQDGTSAMTGKQYYTGLNNPGNWCYANASLQALRAAFAFSNELSSREWQNLYRVPRMVDEIVDHPQLMTKILSNLFHWMNTGQFQIMKAQTLMEYSRHMCHKFPIVQAEFGGPDQQDANEFTTFIMMTLQEETNLRRHIPKPAEFQPNLAHTPYEQGQAYWQWYTQNNQSIVDKHWIGLQRTVIQCIKCSHVAAPRFEPFNPITVNIPDRGTRTAIPTPLEACFKNYASPEKLEDYKCDHCNERGRCIKEVRFIRLPNLLAVTIGRFNFDNFGKLSKDATRVDWDFDYTDLSPFFIDHSIVQEYETFAIVVHAGATLDSGHYYAYVRDPTSVNSTTWLKCNDSYVTHDTLGRRSKNDVLQYGNAVPYMVYMRRKSPAYLNR